MKKMEIYGDSILRGVMYCADSGRYDLCRKNRFASLAEYGIEAKNNSRMGATIARGFELLKRNLAAGAEGTVVLLSSEGTTVISSGRMFPPIRRGNSSRTHRKNSLRIPTGR
jgi:hypothetical protein